MDYNEEISKLLEQIDNDDLKKYIYDFLLYMMNNN